MVIQKKNYLIATEKIDLFFLKKFQTMQNNCDRCNEPIGAPVYRVTSDVISMDVCSACSLAARHLQRCHGDGELTVVEIEGTNEAN